MWRVGLVICLLSKASATASPVFEGTGIKVCESENCKIAAAFIKLAMNNTVDPCDDFYNYACGAWTSNQPIPDGQDIWNLDKLVENYINQQVLDILEEEISDNDVTALKYEKIFHKSCLDTDRLEEIGIQPLKETMNYFGGWPIAMNSSDWDDENHDWQSIHRFYSTMLDLSSIFDVFVRYDQRNHSAWIIELSKPEKMLYDSLRSKLSEDIATEKYTDFIKTVLAVFLQSANKTLSETDITKDAEDIVNLEKHLRLLKFSSNDSSDLYSYMTIRELQHFYDEEKPTRPSSKINWLETIRALFTNVKKEETVEISELEEIAVKDANYLRKLLHLLEETPNRVIVNYVHWRFIWSSMKFTNQQMRELHSRFTTIGQDLEVLPKSRRDRCRADMRIATGYKYEFEKRHVSAEERKLALDMSSEVHSEILDELERSTWLDDEAKEETMIKLHAMKWRISGTSRKYAERVYSDLTIADDYFENVLNVRKFFVVFMSKRLRKLRDARIFPIVQPLHLRAAYKPRHRLMVLSVAQLFSPLLHSSLPLPVNYGYLGPTIGNLMARAMEKEVDTNVYVTPWSSYLGENYKSYESKTECLTRQYRNYSVGPGTIDENMYDAISIKVAYNAFRESFINDNIMALPGLENLTEDQLFFVSYALEKCQTATAKYLAEHEPANFTPNEYRVIGPLSNSEYFAKAFDCPRNSPMNPESKCII